MATNISDHKGIGPVLKKLEYSKVLGARSFSLLIRHTCIVTALDQLEFKLLIKYQVI